eukprot:TRINITY_DN2297_c0_g1_i1.p1 TRINITY_DN2297_c0_g1~~TRINITY_DN2297_c0_g1_i1.p1  ORF type:complete len:235 (-),score=27.26 TRINITY_DN2297_c0_g1_i1:151-855(-)
MSKVPDFKTNTEIFYNEYFLKSWRDQTKITKILKNMGMGVNDYFENKIMVQSDLDRICVLHYICLFSIRDYFKIIIENEYIDINIESEKGNYPLSIALKVSKPDYYIINTLLDRPELELNVSLKNGMNYLMVACQKGLYDAVERLLSFGVIDLNYQDSNGNTALFHALMGKTLIHLDIATLLLSTNEIDLNTTNYDGKNAYQVIPLIPLVIHGQMNKLLNSVSNNKNSTTNTSE